MSDVVIQVRNLRRALGGAQVLSDVSFEVRQGEIFVIMGPSGTGKSVLLKHLIGLLRPDAGEIFLWDIPIHERSNEELDEVRKRIGVVFQGAALFDSLAVGENIAFPIRRHRDLEEPDVQEAVATRLALVGLEGKEDAMPATLSGGMRKRVGIARAVGLNPEIVFYDEPTGGLDPPTARDVDSLIWRLRAYLGMTSVVVTHDLDSAFGIGDRIALMGRGRLIAVGTPEEIEADKRPEIREFLHPRRIVRAEIQ
ncbi:MAG TPA: ABC transporter ATP-binding protein [bacterium]|nr:ABC transporter ATP-binding protein [bacterium]